METHISAQELKLYEEMLTSGVKALDRLAVIIKEYKGQPFSEMSEKEFKIASTAIVEMLKSMPIRPWQILILYEYNRIEASWYIPFEIDFSSITDFLMLVDNFMRMFDSTTDIYTPVFNSGVLDDDKPTVSSHVQAFRKYFGIKTIVKSTKSSTIPKYYERDSIDIIEMPA